MRAALALALCALQAVSSERDEHGMRQALRLARMRAPRERRGPGAGRAQGRTGGMRDFYGGANRTRLWPRTKHLQPLLPAVPTEHLWAGGCCGLGHRTSRLMKLYVYAPLARRSHPRQAQGLAHAMLVSLAAKKTESLERAER